MLLSHFGKFDGDSTANGTFFSFQSLRIASAHSQRIRRTFAVRSQWSQQSVDRQYSAGDTLDN